MPTKRELTRAGATTVVVALLGAAALWQLSGGLRHFTSESWRRASIEAAPRPVPNAALEDHRGHTLQLRDLCGRLLIVDFVYTQCPTVCSALGATSAQLAQRLAGSGNAADVMVLSISLDPARDTPERMRQFKRSLEAVETAWTLARTRTGLAELLEAFGVVVIPDGRSGFEHNAALHAVDRSCRITKVFDMEELDHAEQWLRARL